MPYTFFNLQMAVLSPPHDPFRHKMRELILAAEALQTADDKRMLYGRLRRLILPVLPRVQRVAWDLVRTERARFDYMEWHTDLEDVTDVPDLSANSAHPELQHTIVTVILLAERGTNSDLELGEMCDIAEPMWLRRSTCSRLLDGLKGLSFSSVHGDGIYLQPAPGQPGPTASEMDEGWDNLAAIDDSERAA